MIRVFVLSMLAGRPARCRPKSIIPSGLILIVLAGCQQAHRQASWRVYPLQRQHPHDGLAVVNQPDGFGVHLWLETDTSQEGDCRPRWNPDAARLFNGNGSAPFSSGLASRAEFFEVVQVGAVRTALKRQLEALCRERAPRSSFIWSEPPVRPEQLKPVVYPSLEEPHLLSDPEVVEREEKNLLEPDLVPVEPDPQIWAD